jgi:outer membrane lipoprotein SlyB
MNKILKILSCGLILSASLLISGCTKDEKTIGGVALGAGTGALIGSAAGGTGGGVAGAAIGGVAGGVIGHNLGDDK